MAEETTILQHWIISKFLLPFLLVSFITFAVLEKTKILGDKKPIHAVISFVIGLIFVSAIYPKLVVENMVLFLTVAIVIIFVILLIWGFIFGDEAKDLPIAKHVKKILIIVVCIALVGGILWATGWWNNLVGLFSGNSEMTQTIVVNGVFLIVIAIALALILMNNKGGK